MHSALLACIQGKPGDARKPMPVLVTKQAACVQRSLCVLDLLTSFAASAAVILQMLTSQGEKRRSASPHVVYEMWRVLGGF